MNSYVGTNIGCKPYLAPERINPIRMDDPYDQRSDVWSYGITIVSHGMVQTFIHNHTQFPHFGYTYSLESGTCIILASVVWIWDKVKATVT